MLGCVSKAFTKDDAAEEPLVVPPRPPLPPGITNYVTPRGLASLRHELRRLNLERSAKLDLAGTSSGPDVPALAALHTRIRDLEARLASAVRVDPAAHSRDEVRFGARVTVRGDDGADRRYEIVGVDEADASAGRIAFVAPIARALLGKRAGDVVTLHTPRGKEDLEVVTIE